MRDCDLAHGIGSTSQRRHRTAQRSYFIVFLLLFFRFFVVHILAFLLLALFVDLADGMFIRRR